MLIIEILAAVLTLICVWLTAKRHILSWPVGILAICLYAVVFFDAKLYADLILQLFFIVQSVMGWIVWHRNREANKTYIIKIERLKRNEFRTYLIISVFVYFIAALIFSKYTDASLPYIDSLTATLSLLANYLLLNRKIENWYVWIAADIIYVGMFLYKGLIPSAILYAILLVISIKGYLEWRKIIR